MTKLPVHIIITLIAVVAVLLSLSLVAGCGDMAEADSLVEESEELRRQATDILRRQTAAIDAMSATIASGDSLLLNQVGASAETIGTEYRDAAAALESRSEKLGEAAALDLDDAYREYLHLLAASNAELLAAIAAAGAIPDLILADRQALAGWDEVRAAEVVEEIGRIQQQVEEKYEAAETLRAEADRLREDSPDDFE